ncbi:MAG: hypothetical protein J6S53_04365 [Lentisphaeria bacterium]|nr:hypothetical protein [Lentisphaeria bacterium]
MNKRKDKKNPIYKVLFVAVLILLFCLLLFLALAAWKYHKTVSSGEKVTILEKSFSVPEKVFLGEKFTVTILYRVPWGTQEEEAAFLSVPENMLVTSPPYFRKEKNAWGYRIMKGIYPLQAFADGKSTEGSLIARFRNGKGVESSFNEKIPAITVQPLKTESSDLLTEGEITAEKVISFVPYIAVSLIILLVLAGFLVFFFRKRKDCSSGTVPPWVLAVNAIEKLLRKVRKGDTRVEQSIAELSDIVRFYMEKRFSIPAEHQTSDEFFLALNSRKNLLTDLQQEFLRKFLRSADLVKFAALPADLSLMEEAAVQAENLVRETIPPEETEENEKKNRKGKKKK